jgi:hypothetical protein
MLGFLKNWIKSIVAESFTLNATTANLANLQETDGLDIKNLDQAVSKLAHALHFDVERRLKLSDDFREQMVLELGKIKKTLAEIESRPVQKKKSTTKHRQQGNKNDSNQQDQAGSQNLT